MKFRGFRIFPIGSPLVALRTTPRRWPDLTRAARKQLRCGGLTRDGCRCALAAILITIPLTTNAEPIRFTVGGLQIDYTEAPAPCSMRLRPAQEWL
jgi:hypothetical protein